eukprot:Blabericola_migrator_1__395@NODE_109_length_14038_cov_78_087968_g97_i0_p4_GENE_NODE_109_length_14038_cov_78_087968_g97_i0NODE_109_length_14038_cov_78_087968_g97_i0_p4_ORF_typecomplete_len362_score53_17_NODE_109_length_14038_cov_78_087968_g97_i0291114
MADKCCQAKEVGNNEAKFETPSFDPAKQSHKKKHIGIQVFELCNSMSLKEQRCERQSKHRRARNLYRVERRALKASVGKANEAAEGDETDSPSETADQLQTSSPRYKNDCPTTSLRRAMIVSRRGLRRHLWTVPAPKDTLEEDDDSIAVTWDPPDPADWESLNLPSRRPVFDHAIPDTINCCGAWGLSTDFYSTSERLCPFAFCGTTDFTAINIKLRSLIIASGQAGYSNIYWLKICAMMCAMALRHKLFESLYSGYLKRSKSLRHVGDEVHRWGTHFHPLPEEVTVRMIQELLKAADGSRQDNPLHFKMFHWLADVICSYTVAIFVLEQATFFFGPSRQVLRLARGVKRVIQNLFHIEIE